jgi:hypothetical protein
MLPLFQGTYVRVLCWMGELATANCAALTRTHTHIHTHGHVHTFTKHIHTHTLAHTQHCVHTCCVSGKRAGGCPLCCAYITHMEYRHAQAQACTHTYTHKCTHRSVCTCCVEWESWWPRTVQCTSAWTSSSLEKRELPRRKWMNCSLRCKLCV